MCWNLDKICYNQCVLHNQTKSQNQNQLMQTSSYLAINLIIDSILSKNSYQLNNDNSKNLYSISPQHCNTSLQHRNSRSIAIGILSIRSIEKLGCNQLHKIVTTITIMNTFVNTKCNCNSKLLWVQIGNEPYLIAMEPYPITTESNQYWSMN